MAILRHTEANWRFIMIIAVNTVRMLSIFRYVGINVGAPTRAVMLEDHWSFVCTCKRCLDPTELGTYASALRCLACGPDR